MFGKFFSKKASLESIQPKPTEGKNPKRFSSANFSEPL